MRARAAASQGCGGVVLGEDEQPQGPNPMLSKGPQGSKQPGALRIVILSERG